MSAAAQKSTFDVIVIGAGPAGEVVAGRLAQDGLAVAIIEARLVGGECAFYACMPSKALLRPGEVLAEIERVPGAAEAVSGQLDVAATLTRRDEVVHGLKDDAQLGWLQERKITLLRGHGRIDGERVVVLDGERYEARLAIVIAVGSAAAMPPITGLAQARPWTNREATTSARVPARLIILGAGPVGVEMAQAYRRLGSEVCLIDTAERLLPREEGFASEQLAQAFARIGIETKLGAHVASVQRDGDEVTATLADGWSTTGEEILVAAGRRPLTDDLGLETVGLVPGKAIQVQDTMRVAGLPWLYALGDVNERALLTHAGKYQARVAALNIAGGDVRDTSESGGVPRVVFTDPEIAAVGLTLAAARERGIDVRAYDVDTSGNAGASFRGRGTPGTCRLVVDEARGVIVGATFTGTEVAEMLQAATVAVAAEVAIERLWDAIPPFPTRSEIWLRLLEQRERELTRAKG